ncbi:MAG: [protein-PII] uridylyltransferase [Methyloligellaceae bacterium]
MLINAKKVVYPPLFDAEELDRDLQALVIEHKGNDTELRSTVLARLKNLLASVYEKAEAELIESGDGPGCAEALSLFQDQLIGILYDFTVKNVYLADNPSRSEHMAIIATGGYGRGLLAPKSDIDLLFLLPYKQTAWGESVVEYILYFLWDLGFKVGHATRSIDQCIQLSRSDFTIRTAILDARLIWGDASLFNELKERFDGDVVEGSGREFIEAKLDERDARHEQSGQTRYLVEPNIKDGKGGLRDLHTLYWISKYVTEAERAADFIQAGIFSPKEYKNFVRCEHFLWTVRCHLHFLTGRPEERLTFDIQQEMAARLNYQDRGGERAMYAVERFMRHYFLIAKEVGALTRVVCLSLEIKELKGAPTFNRVLKSSFWLPKKKIDLGSDDFVLINDRLAVADDGVFKKDPVNIIRLFHIAETYKTLFHPDTIRLVRASWRLIDDDLRENKEANRIFLELLCSQTNSESVLRKMNEVGVLGRFIKDFGRVVCMMQFNMYHHYTVDEHLIRAVGILNQIETGAAEEDHPVISRVIQRVHYKRALYVAVLLHDIAKGREEDHSIAGARIARELCPRFGLSKIETETVAWLIENHLVMSQTAQSRDLNDPKTIRDFADMVQTRERLMLLLILTVCDIRAVGPGVWNGWKRQLIRSLYFSTQPLLAGGYSDVSQESQIAKAKELVRIELKDWSEAEQNSFINRHSDNYWVRTELKHQILHAELLKQWDAEKQMLVFNINVDENSGVTEITVVTKGIKQLLTNISGACASSGANIVGAQISTTLDGLALDTIVIKREFPRSEDEKRRANRIIKMLGSLLSGEQKIDQITVDKGRKAQLVDVFSVDPEVIIDDNLSEEFTVLEFNAPDQAGLLFHVMKVLAKYKLIISSAHIATFGEKAVDVFYISNFKSRNINKENLVEELIDIVDD